MQAVKFESPAKHKNKSKQQLQNVFVSNTEVKVLDTINISYCFGT